MTRNSRQHPDILVKIKLDLETSAKCSAVLNALIPDNVNFPEGLSLKMSARSSRLYLRVAGKGLPLKTIVNTVDEILEDVSVCQKVMSD